MLGSLLPTGFEVFICFHIVCVTENMQGSMGGGSSSTLFLKSAKCQNGIYWLLNQITVHGDFVNTRESFQ